MPSCVFKGCTNSASRVNKRNDDISFYRFPSDPVRFEIWSRIVRKQRMEPYFKCRIGMRACSGHFTKDDFHVTDAGLRRLKKTAVPSIKVQPYLLAEANKGDQCWEIEIDTTKIKIEPDESCSQENSGEIKGEIDIKREPDESCSQDNTQEINREIDIKIEPDESHSQGNSLEIERENGIEKETDKDCSQEDLKYDNISVVQSVFDTPHNIALEQKLRRVILRDLEKTKKMKTLQKQNRRLKQRNESLVAIVKELKEKILRVTRALDQATQLEQVDQCTDL